MHKRQRINQLNSGEKYETIPKSRDRNTRLLRAVALAGRERGWPSPILFILPGYLSCLSCSSLSTLLFPPTAIPRILRRLSFHSDPPIFSIIVAQKISRYGSSNQPRNRSLNASTYKVVWLDGTRPWLFWFTLTFPDCGRLYLYLAAVGCVSMILLPFDAGARAGSVTVVWCLGRRREHIAPEAAREKCGPPKCPPPRA